MCAAAEGLVALKKYMFEIRNTVFDNVNYEDQLEVWSKVNCNLTSLTCLHAGKLTSEQVLEHDTLNIVGMVSRSSMKVLLSVASLFSQPAQFSFSNA